MTDSDITPAAGRHLTPLEVIAIVVVAGAAIGRLWLALALDLDGDEAYYASWAGWPSLDYLDHPPGVALSIWAGQALFGPTVFGVRAFALVAQLLIAAALWRTTRLLVPEREAGAVALIWYSLTLAAGTSFVATPDAPSALFWTLSVWAAAEAVSRTRPNWWLAVGLFAGLGLASKYTNAWLGIGLVIFLLLSRDGRRQLPAWQLWAGGVVALLVFSPILWWQATHEWRSFLFQGVRVVASEGSFGAFVPEFLLSQAAMTGPVLLACSLLGTASWIIGRSDRRGARLALPILTSLPLLVYFLVHSLHSRVEANWPLPVVPMMTVVAAWMAVSLRSRLWLSMLSVAHGIFGLALIVFVTWQAIFVPLDLGIADRTRMLRGWSTLAAEVRELADVHGARSILTDGNYRLSGELYFYGQAARDPRPVRSLRDIYRYDYIPPAERFPRDFPALFLVQGEVAPTRWFDSVEAVGKLTRGTGRAIERYTAFIVSAPTAAFPDAVD
jgi:4-amino-4-deoxy-L-arabinose transferase-like glycosyltransferase